MKKISKVKNEKETVFVKETKDNKPFNCPEILNDDELSFFNNKEIKAINLVKKITLNDNDFNEEQMKIIKIGLEQGLDVSIYAKPEFDRYQMEQIREGLYWARYSLNTKKPVSIYADPKFTSEQMEQIRLGIRKNINVSKYAKPEFSAEQMEIIRQGLTYLKAKKERKNR